ncbi:hypothetical protein F5Y16DRAFT_385460 [Xylariaceae sp. FL0255]|nr:hypothetical protein F5Y16DRAFT_385460 [Xylariaceae sp. FL0255]
MCILFNILNLLILLFDSLDQLLFRPDVLWSILRACDYAESNIFCCDPVARTTSVRQMVLAHRTKVLPRWADRRKVSSREVGVVYPMFEA